MKHSGVVRALGLHVGILAFVKFMVYAVCFFGNCYFIERAHSNNPRRQLHFVEIHPQMHPRQLDEAIASFGGSIGRGIRTRSTLTVQGAQWAFNLEMLAIWRAHSKGRGKIRRNVLCSMLSPPKLAQPSGSKVGFFRV